MDNLTHSLTGLMLARAGLNREVPRGTLLVMIAANVPDIDVISGFWGAHVYLDQHRGLTHSLMLSPVIALLPMLVLRAFSIRAFAASLVGVLSHLALDWTNIYGIRLLEPLTPTWFRGDLAPVADPWFWTVLTFAVLWPALAGLVTSEIGGRGDYGRGTARFALALLLVYCGMRWFLHERAVETLQSRLYGGAAPVRVAALPSLANPVTWNALVELEGAYHMQEFSLLRDYDPDAGHILYKSPPNPAAAATPAFQAFLRFSQFPLWLRDEGRAECLDLRFGLPGEGRFAAIAEFDDAGRITRSRYQFGPPGSAPRLR